MLHIFFFFNDTATTEIYTLSLHDALPICLFGSIHVAEEARASGTTRFTGCAVRVVHGLPLGEVSDLVPDEDVGHEVPSLEEVRRLWSAGLGLSRRSWPRGEVLLRGSW